MIVVVVVDDVMHIIWRFFLALGTTAHSERRVKWTPDIDSMCAFELSRSTRSVIIDYKFDLIESFWFHSHPSGVGVVIRADASDTAVATDACHPVEWWLSQRPDKLLCYTLYSQTDIPTPSFTSTQTINFSPKCIKFCTENFCQNSTVDCHPYAGIRSYSRENHRLWRWFHFMCQWKSVASNCAIAFGPEYGNVREKKRNTSHRNILTSSFQQFRFRFFSSLFSILFTSLLAALLFFFASFFIKKQFSLSIFRRHFIAFALHCRFVASHFHQFRGRGRVRAKERERERIVFSDYLLNDIMTSNLVINQILIVLFVAVNIQTDTFFDAMNPLFSDAYGEAKTGKTWTTTMMALALPLLLLLIRRTDKVIISMATTTTTTKKDVRKFHIK